MADSAYQRALAYANEDAATNAVPDQEGQFVKGVRAGTYGLGSSLRNAFGAVGDAVGADEFAQGQYTEADRLAQRAQETGPRVSSYKDVRSLRDAVDYGLGTVGQVVPSALPGLIPGMAAATPLRALAGATLAYTPMEMGDTVAKMRTANPGQPLSAEDALTAAGTGVVSAGLQSVVPAMVGGKLVGQGAKAATGQSLKRIIGKNLVGEGLMEGAMEGGSEALKQVGANPNAPIDWEAVKENAVGGMVGGGAMGGLGAVGDIAHAAPANAWIGAKNALKTGQEALGKAKETLTPDWAELRPQIDAGVAAMRETGQSVWSAMPESVKGVGDYLKTGVEEQIKSAREAYTNLMASDSVPAAIKQQATEAFQNLGVAANRGYLWSAGKLAEAKTAIKDTEPESLMGRLRSIAKPVTNMADTILNSESMEATKEFAGKTTDQISEALKEREAKAQQWAAEEGPKFMAREGVSEKLKSRMASALADLSKRSNVMEVASIVKGHEAGEKISSGLKSVYEKASSLFGKKDDGTKKSEDYSGFEQVILQKIGPMIAEAHPALLENTKSLQQLGGTLRLLSQAMAEGKDLKKGMLLARLSDTIGPDLAHNVLLELGPVVARDPKASTAYFNSLNEMHAENKANAGLVEVIGKHRTDQGLSDSNTELARLIRKHVAGGFDEGLSPEQAKAQNAAFLDHMDKEFGPKAKNVLAVAEREAKANKAKLQAETVDEDGAPLAEQGEGKQYVGAGKNQRSLVKQPGSYRAEFGNESVAERIMKEHGQSGEVKFVTASEDPTILDKVPAFKKFKTDTKKAVEKEFASQIKDAATSGDEGRVKDVSSQVQAEVDKRVAERVKHHQTEGHGLVEISAFEDSDKLTTDELHGIRLDASEHSESPSRIDVKDGLIVDAVRLTKTMLKKTPFSDFGEQSKLHRIAEAYMSGLAQLMNDHGKFPVSGKTVIGKINGKDVTAADAIRAFKNSDTVKSGYGLNDPSEMTTATLERQIKGMRNQLRELYAENPEAEGVANAISTIEEKLSRAVGFYQRAADQEHFAREKARGGQQEVGKDEQIHTAAAEHEGTGELQHRVNMDGTLVSHYSDGQKSTAKKQNFLAKAVAAKRAREDRRIEPDEYLDGSAESVNAQETEAHEAARKETRPDPKAVAAKKAAFLERAASGDAELLKEIQTEGNAKGLQRAAEALYGRTDANSVKTLMAVNDRLGELIAADPSVAYGLQTKKYSFDATAATNPTGLTAKGRAQILDYLNRAVPWVQAEFPFLKHAGEFTVDMGQAIIRVSMHALNPTTVAYHESLHAFFQHLKDNSHEAISHVLYKAASTPKVTAQLRKLLAHSPEALAQLSNVEERAAYMYQFWADGKLDLNPTATTLFEKIAEGFRKVLGIWSNDQHALNIMEYFHSGEYAKNGITREFSEKGHNKAIESLKGMSKGFMELGEAVFGAGSANLRDSGVPALAELADLIKRKDTGEGGDQGYLPAARIMRSEFMNRLAPVLGGDRAAMNEALEALQNGTKASSPEAQIIQGEVRKVLDDVYDYLHKAGVDVGNLGVGKDYFPRQWDAHYLSTKEGKAAFFQMARKYTQWADPQKTYQALIGADGAALPTVDRPGFSAKHERSLSFISHADAAPFMNKDLTQILNSYVTQATRRGEWSRRFTDSNKGLEDILRRAKAEGADERQIEQAKKFVAGVNGTLGDDLNPTLRRYMGNMIVYQNIRLLPLAIFSSVVDPMGIMVRGGSVGDAWSAFKRGVKEVPAGLKGQQIKDYWTDMAETLDVVDNASLQHALGALYTQGVVSDNAKKINDTFFRFNLMEQFGRSMRVGATEAALKFMAKHADGKASQHSVRWMAELGLKAGDIKLTPEGRPAISVAEGLTEAQAARVKAAVNQWVDGAILRPDAADKPVWMNDPHFMLVSHLKQFVYSFHHTIIDRVVHEARNGNISPALALTSYVPVMLAADMVKGLLQGGGDEPEWKRPWGAGDYLMNATERAGLFGVGQFGVEAIHGNYGALTGPTLEQLTEGVQVLGGSRQFKTFALHSLPANSVYATAAREGKNDTFDNPE